MTKVIITNANNTIATAGPYYIEIEATKIEFDNTANIQTTLEKPKAPAKQSTVSETKFIDLQKRAKIITIYGVIDKYSNRASLGGAASEVHDAGVVRKRLDYLWDRGGTNRLYIGYGDGYYNRADTSTENEYTEGIIEKMKFTEGGADHVDRISNSEDYPSGTKEKVMQYDVIITFHKGEGR